MTETTTHPEPPRRVIAIVGRPNVGKSALFNRIVRQRVAIVHEQSGVTRDRLVMEVNWHEERFELIDTGGLAMMDGAATPDVIEEGIRQQVQVAVQDAAAVVLVGDITAGCMPLDEEVARILRDSNTPVCVAVNKADVPEMDDRATDFERLGFPVFPVSALHNRGIGDLLEQAMENLPPPEAPVEAEALKIAIIGRPNVGKSSYLNRLLNNERVIVSEIPGTTRDSVEVPFVVGSGPQARHYRLIDTAGIRRYGKVDNVVERFSGFRTERSIERADVVIMMMNAEEGPTSQDKRIARMILDNARGCLLLVNKWDIASEADITQRKYGSALHEALPFLNFVPTVFVSAKSGYNIRKSIEAIDYVAAQVATQLGTGLLNRVLHDAFERTQPPLVNGHRLKFYYATQTGIKPIRIMMFVNNRKKLRATYETYLVNCLRKAFGLEGAPIRLRFRTTHDRDRQSR